jgi:nucleotide-binding universal stress UspA family protein
VALKRVNREIDGMERVKARTAHVKAARTALAMRFDTACKERASKVLGEVRTIAEQIGVSAELLHIPNAHPATAIVETAKSRGWDLIVIALSRASRPQEAVLGEPSI